MRRAKIVCTIGPATESPEQIRALVDAGMDVARLNRSHGDTELHEKVYHRVREAAAAAGRPVAVLVDLQGPKIRLGTFVDGKHELEVGDTFTITTEDVPGTKELVPTTHRACRATRVGDPISSTTRCSFASRPRPRVDASRCPARCRTRASTCPGSRSRSRPRARRTPRTCAGPSRARTSSRCPRALGEGLRRRAPDHGGGSRRPRDR